MRNTRYTSFGIVAGKQPRASFLIVSKLQHEEEEDVETLEGLVKILKRPSNQRNAKSLYSLNKFAKGIKFFKQLANEASEEAVAQCCLHMTYETYGQGEVVFNQFIFHQGDVGSKFYILIEGACAVYVDLKSASGIVTPTEVAKYTKGDSFGEYALLNNKPRAATIICTHNSHFAVLEKADYTRILSKVHEMKIAQKVDFLLTLPMFKKWTRGSMQKLTYYFKEKVFHRKQVINRAGDPAMEVYLIKEGEVQVFKDIHIKGKTVAFRSPRVLTTHAEVVILGKGESIGHEEVSNDRKHKFTYICQSATVQVLAILKEVRRNSGLLEACQH